MRRSGFTLVELLVVIAIIGIVLSLALPAVQQVRAASRRLECQHNLKQIGLAIHNYDATHRCFPPAAFNVGDVNVRSRRDGDAWGWPVMLLPYLDQTALYDRLDPQGQVGIFQDFYKEHNLPMPQGGEHLAVFRCIASTLPNVSTNVGPEQMAEWQLGYGTSDYKGCEGNGGATGVFEDIRSLISSSQGIIRMTDVRDGSSQTIAVGESSHPGSEGTVWPQWIGSSTSVHSLTFQSDRYYDSPDPIRLNGKDKVRIGQYWRTLEGTSAVDNSTALSFHRGGVQFLFVDGSVHFISDDIDARTYRRLCDRRDGGVVGDF